MKNIPITLILDNIRSTHNVGSILRTADAVGVTSIVVCGYTPYPRLPQDQRPPHVIAANTHAIAKTALGAHQILPITHQDSVEQAITHLRDQNYTIAALEQAEGSISPFLYMPTGPLALILGNEVTGLTTSLLSMCDVVLELPMAGQKESLNVSVAAGITLYALRHSS